ncbi:hypothetical protein BPOR_0246g00010 [Botrytis porri]|uniref:Uncharacterized protein n=1 Tax=Botrytis porri TaxID=87229 RepID=A0A4Z1KQU4_9HELO|nr:hypothetical protein BPOR_0246g00010 [Botrytis porri]
MTNSNNILPNNQSMDREYTSTNILNPATPPFYLSGASENSSAHISTTILNPASPPFYPFATSGNSGAPAPTTFLNPATPPFTPSPEFFFRRLQGESIGEDDCGFPHCGGFCELYARSAASRDNNGVGQKASSPAVQDIEELGTESGYDGGSSSEDGFLGDDDTDSEYSSS